MRYPLIIIAGVLSALLPRAFAVHTRKECIVKGMGSNETDDAPAIIKAFEECGHGGRVILEDEMYFINSVMNVSWLSDVEIDIKGTLLVCKSLEPFHISLLALIMPCPSGVPILNIG